MRSSPSKWLTRSTAWPSFRFDKLNVFGIQENHAPAVVNSAIAIVQTVNRRVELIVAAHRHHQKLIRLQIDFRQRMNGEVRFTIVRVELPVANWIRQIEAARLSHARVVIVEIRNDVLDVFADAIVIANQSVPIDTWTATAESRFRQPGDNRRLT